MGVNVSPAIATPSEPLSTSWIKYGVAVRVMSTMLLLRATTMLAAPPSIGIISRLIPSCAKKPFRRPMEKESADIVLIVDGICPYRSITGWALTFQKEDSRKAAVARGAGRIGLSIIHVKHVLNF